MSTKKINLCPKWHLFPLYVNEISLKSIKQLLNDQHYEGETETKI